MADFCKKCSLEMFGYDFGDFAGLITKEEVERGLVAQVLCEGCELIYVDHTGEKFDGFDLMTKTMKGNDV